MKNNRNDKYVNSYITFLYNTQYIKCILKSFILSYFLNTNVLVKAKTIELYSEVYNMPGGKMPHSKSIMDKGNSK